jgi:hypothetical protein
LNPEPSAFRLHELGLFLPPAAAAAADEPLARFTRTYLTYAELTGHPPLDEDQLVARLQRMSSADCLMALAQVGARLFVGGSREADGDIQLELVHLVVGDAALGRALSHKLADPRWSAIFCEQQLVHLTRLVILHCAHRPPDNFSGGRLYEDWVTCLLGVTDLLDAGLRVESADQRLSWEIRQCQLNHHAEQLPAVAIHYELYSRLWPELLPEGMGSAEQSFRTITGLSISEYFMVGSAVMARLTSYGYSGDGAPLINPDAYFSSAKLDPGVPRAFFAFTSRSVDELKSALRDERQRYGATTYGSLAFERFPLVEAQPGLFLPTSIASLQRRITEGVFHVLAEAAETEGRDRRHYTSAFGNVFQVLVERTIRRGESALPSPSPITADVHYGSRRHRRASSDVIVAYERNPVFIEVVSGPLQVATTTRGDLHAFSADLQRLVIGKAKQLSRSIDDFLAGDLEIDGAQPTTTSRIWPVIVTSHSFPHAETVMDAVRDGLVQAGYLQQDKVGGLAIVSAEDLFFCEGHMQHGRTFLALLRSWKTGRGANFSFKNELIALGQGRAPSSKHFEHRFAEANASWINALLGGALDAEGVLGAAIDEGGPTVRSEASGP